MRSLVLNGRIRGRTIELEEEVPNLPDGERVRVQLFVPDKESMMRAFGRWANDDALDAALEQIDRERHAKKIS